MKKQILAGLAGLFLFSSAVGADSSFTYVVYRASYTKLNYDNLALNGKLAAPVSILQTRTLIAANTNYAFNEVSYDAGSALETTYQTLVAQGKAILVQINTYSTDFDEVGGGFRTHVEHQKVANPPDDLLAPWTIKVST